MSLSPMFPLPPPHVRMDAAEPHFAGARQSCRQERWPALVERHGVKAILKVGLGQLQMMADIEQVVPEIAEAEGRNDIPHAEKPNPRLRLDHRLGAGPADAAVHEAMTEIERRGRTATESGDVDDRVARRPLLTEVIVGFVDAWQLAQSERPAQHLAQRTEARAHAGHVEVLRAGVLAIGLGKSDHVRVRGIRIVTVLRSVPTTVECVQRHVLLLQRVRRGQALLVLERTTGT